MSLIVLLRGGGGRRTFQPGVLADLGVVNVGAAATFTARGGWEPAVEPRRGGSQ